MDTITPVYFRRWKSREPRKLDNISAQTPAYSLLITKPCLGSMGVTFLGPPQSKVAMLWSQVPGSGNSQGSHAHMHPGLLQAKL